MARFDKPPSVLRPVCVWLLSELREYDAAVSAYMERLKEEKLWRCVSCNKTSYNRNRISEHVERHHVDWPQGLRCPVTEESCYKKFPTREGLFKHMRMKHNLRVGKRGYAPKPL